MGRYSPTVLPESQPHWLEDVFSSAIAGSKFFNDYENAERQQEIDKLTLAIMQRDARVRRPGAGPTQSQTPATVPAYTPTDYEGTEALGHQATAMPNERPKIAPGQFDPLTQTFLNPLRPELMYEAYGDVELPSADSLEERRRYDALQGKRSELGMEDEFSQLSETRERTFTGSQNDLDRANAIEVAKINAAPRFFAGQYGANGAAVRAELQVIENRINNTQQDIDRLLKEKPQASLLADYDPEGPFGKVHAQAKQVWQVKYDQANALLQELYRQRDEYYLKTENIPAPGQPMPPMTPGAAFGPRGSSGGAQGVRAYGRGAAGVDAASSFMGQQQKMFNQAPRGSANPLDRFRDPTVAPQPVDAVPPQPAPSPAPAAPSWNPSSPFSPSADSRQMQDILSGPRAPIGSPTPTDAAARAKAIREKLSEAEARYNRLLQSDAVRSGRISRAQARQAYKEDRDAILAGKL